MCPSGRNLHLYQLFLAEMSEVCVIFKPFYLKIRQSFSSLLNDIALFVLLKLPITIFCHQSKSEVAIKIPVNYMWLITAIPYLELN